MSNTTKSNVTESDTFEKVYKPNTRLFIPHLNSVGTVVDLTNDYYTLKVMRNKKEIYMTVHKDMVIEQPTLPFDELIF